MAGDRRRLRGAETASAQGVRTAGRPRGGARRHGGGGARARCPAELATIGQGEATEVAVRRVRDRVERHGHRLPRRAQVPDLGYSPPCFAFAGDNGGETARGVTADTIKVTVPGHVRPQPAAAARPARRRAPRRVERRDRTGPWRRWSSTSTPTSSSTAGRSSWSGYDGRGQILPEFTGGGQDAATNDSIKVANEIGAFADITGITQPYADALARNQVVADRGALHVARVVRRRTGPTPGASCPTARSRPRPRPIYANGRLFGRDGRPTPATTWPAEERTAGGHRPQQPRVPAVRRHVRGADRRRGQRGGAAPRLHARSRPAQDPGGQPDGQAQGRGHHVGVVRLRPDHADVPGPGGHGHRLLPRVAHRRRRASSTWTSAARSSRRTRPTSGCGPSAAAPAAAQRRPSAASPTPPTARSATTSRRCSSTSCSTSCSCWRSASRWPAPSLTPETFETGLFSYPGGTGQAGAWDFGPGHYTPITDIREIWWDPDAISAFNGEPGHVRRQRAALHADDMPEGEPEVFP